MSRLIGAIAVLLAVVPSCDHSIDTTRKAPRKATLGDDIYGLMCDRLGASVLAEDLAGASYHDICHFDAAGQYGSSVDTSVLPQVRGQAATTARQLSLAKMERMAAYRSELVKAFNAAFPDIDIPDPTTDRADDTVALHDALLRFSQDITPLYETNPFGGDDALIPMMTDAFGRLFGAMEDSPEAHAALQSIAGRQGYRPFNLGLGAIRTLLAYPSLRPFITAQLEVMGPDGSAASELQNVLDVVKNELLTSAPIIAPLSPFVDGPSPNRARTDLEVGAALLLAQDDAFVGLSGDPARFITRRDRRGFAIPSGNTPGVPGTVPAPFVDNDGDGFADIDKGAFVTDGSALITPFFIPGQDGAPPVDNNGLPQGSPYAYIDTSRTLLAALARDLVKLMDPTKFAPDGDAAPWLSEHETLMYALSGMRLLAGPRAEAQFDHASETVMDATPACDHCTKYTRFVGEQSPLAQLIHAAGQLLAHPDSDVMLLGLIELLENHRPVVARLVGAMLRIKAIADQHPDVELAYKVPVWDEMAQTVHGMAQHPGLIADLLAALADPAIIEQHDTSRHFGDTLAAFMQFRDKYTYDPNNINGPAYNLTDGGGFADPHNVVDRNAPLSGDNRSMFEQAAQMIYDGTGVRACNKDGARIYSGLPLVEFWPLIGSYNECELFTFENIGAVYLQSQLRDGHPKRAELVIKDGQLDALLNFASVVISKDAFLESAAGIDGMTLHPSPEALARLMFFGADSDTWGQLPDYDAANAGTNTARFVDNAIEPIGGLVCPPNANGVNTCTSSDDVLRMRDRGVIFAWERLGFTEYLKPQLHVWAELACDDAVTMCDVNDLTGESFFLDLVGTLWRHWPSADAGPYCQIGGDKTSPRYCSGAGINRYEPILVEALQGDLIPALHEFAIVAQTVSITYQRGPKAGQTIRGSEIIELITRLLFDQTYAANAGIVDLTGNAATTWVDGTPQAQVTPFAMFANALRAMDLTFDNSDEPDAAERKSKWKRARSNLTDVFLQVEGEQNASRFANPATPAAMLAGLSILRAQLNANCPAREAGGGCAWAQSELGAKMAGTLSRPVFATIQDLTERISQHESARRELEWFLSYALQAASEGDALSGMLASLTDLMQLLVADDHFAPIFNAVSVAANRADDKAGAGCADRTIQVFQALTGDTYDRFRVLDHILPALVTPMDGGTNLPPLEVIVNAIADIHREDAALDTPLDADDYQYVMKTLREFLTDETRGMRQLYYIVENRPR